jgi:dipeptidyl aminopeptidase/acylaminoacyl peptidase
MDRDLRGTPLYKEIEEHFRRIHEPSFGRLSGAMELAPSPDGRLIAFTGTRVDKLEGSPSTRIGLADVEAGDVTEITSGPNDDRLPKWSPDGTRLAFLSDRKEKGRHQLYLLEAGGVGEAVSTPEVRGTVEFLSWSPDGSSILLLVASPGADRAGAQGSGSMARGPEDLPSWMPEIRTAGREDEWRRLYMYDVAEGTTRVLSRDGLNVWEATWCGSGRIAAMISEHPGEDAWYDAALALVGAGTGREQVILATGRSDRQLAWPAASPSGRRLAAVRGVASDRQIVAGDVLLIDPYSGEVKEIDTQGCDVTWLAWRDEERLFYCGQRGLDTVAGDIDAQTGAAAESWSNGESFGQRYPEAHPVGGDAFAAVLESYERPPEIALFREGKPETVGSLVSEGTRYLSEIGGRLERVAWTAPDGLEVQGLLAVPEGPGPHPLVLFVHGGPVWAYRNRWSMGYVYTPLLVSRGYAVLHPNPRGSSGRGQDFMDMVVGDMGGTDADDLLAGLDALVDRGIADPQRLGVTGGSYGGFMTSWLVTRTDRFAAAVSISPVTDWYSQHWSSNIGYWDSVFLRQGPGPGGPYFERSPAMHAAGVETPTLSVAGAQDRCTPAGQAVEFHQALLEQGVESA